MKNKHEIEKIVKEYLDTNLYSDLIGRIGHRGYFPTSSLRAGSEGQFLTTTTDQSGSIYSSWSDRDTYTQAQSDASYIPYSMIQAKGDLIAGTSETSVDNVVAGGNGFVPTYDTGETAGIVGRANCVPQQIEMLKLRGSAVEFGTIDPMVCTGSLTLVDGSLYGFPIYVPYDFTATGIWFVQNTQGVYTADNENRVGLYTLSGTTATRVARSANTGTLFSAAAANTFVQEPLTATENLVGGTVYYVCFLWNTSTGSPTAPQLVATPSIQGAAQRLDLATGTGLTTGITGQTTMPSSFTVAVGLTRTVLCGVY